MKPIPPEAGTLRCILDRESTGWYKFFPKYTLMLEDDSREMLQARKIKSKTAHYRIEIVNNDGKYQKTPDSNYLGRLRANNNNSAFYLFDHGNNAADFKKKGGSLRR